MSTSKYAKSPKTTKLVVAGLIFLAACFCFPLFGIVMYLHMCVYIYSSTYQKKQTILNITISFANSPNVAHR